MNWNNLKNNKCPNCVVLLIFDKQYKMHRCEICGFAISDEKFNQIVENLYRKSKMLIKSDDDRLAELNNLGRDEIAEDFSDSPYL